VVHHAFENLFAKRSDADPLCTCVIGSALRWTIP
jgi:hypothetical protein